MGPYYTSLDHRLRTRATLPNSDMVSALIMGHEIAPPGPLLVNLKCHCSMGRTPILNRFLTQFWYGNTRKHTETNGFRGPPIWCGSNSLAAINCHRRLSQACISVCKQPTSCSAGYLSTKIFQRCLVNMSKRHSASEECTTLRSLNSS